ncbi:uncharacterized protein LOC128336455 [Hemicordylus capensis]|uniref:uncharacterized protein LOC128336455 n=1 Tax=Hemicordylus capensis TaxID=884348 RepID=UPI0023032BDE|nr:uncharacterized protein LOC128336455 [Hemicordylus capensis]XP_053132118.1 uncharacterized protein LOC128336455 [Hemicordylus capensis]
MISHNMSWIEYPSQSRDSLTRFEEIIYSNNVISRLMHGYIALFVPVGLVAGVIILAIFIKNYRQHDLEKLDILLFAHTISNLLMILFSFTVTARPDYLEVSYFECGVLSFFSNLSYFSSQYLLILMVLSIFLHRHPPQNTFIKKAHKNPLICVGFVLTCAFCAALIVVALLGVENYDKGTDCQLDPLFAWPEYEIIKFTFGFGLPSLSQLLCFILLLMKETRPEIHPPGQNVHPYLTVLVITITTFMSSLFYNIMILSRTNLKIQRSIGTPQNELTMNTAEILLFSMSCANLVIILFLHKPYRSGLWNIITNLTKVCRRRQDSNRSVEMPETHTEVSSAPSENGSPMPS